MSEEPAAVKSDGLLEESFLVVESSDLLPAVDSNSTASRRAKSTQDPLSRGGPLGAAATSAVGHAVARSSEICTSMSPTGPSTLAEQEDDDGFIVVGVADRAPSGSEKEPPKPKFLTESEVFHPRHELARSTVANPERFSPSLSETEAPLSDDEYVLVPELGKSVDPEVMREQARKLRETLSKPAISRSQLLRLGHSSLHEEDFQKLLSNKKNDAETQADGGAATSHTKADATFASAAGAALLIGEQAPMNTPGGARSPERCSSQKRPSSEASHVKVRKVPAGKTGYKPPARPSERANLGRGDSAAAVAATREPLPLPHEHKSREPPSRASATRLRRKTRGERARQHAQGNLRTHERTRERADSRTRGSGVLSGSGSTSHDQRRRRRSRKPNAVGGVRHPVLSDSRNEHGVPPSSASSSPERCSVCPPDKHGHARHNHPRGSSRKQSHRAHSRSGSQLRWVPKKEADANSTTGTAAPSSMTDEPHVRPPGRKNTRVRARSKKKEAGTGKNPQPRPRIRKPPAAKLSPAEKDVIDRGFEAASNVASWLKDVFIGTAADDAAPAPAQPHAAPPKRPKHRSRHSKNSKPKDAAHARRTSKQKPGDKTSKQKHGDKSKRDGERRAAKETVYYDSVPDPDSVQRPPAPRPRSGKTRRPEAPRAVKPHGNNDAAEQSKPERTQPKKDARQLTREDVFSPQNELARTQLLSG